MSSTCIITGAGSGVGRAVAVKLGQQGWKLGLVGRRAEALEETRKLTGSPEVRVFPCDIGDPEAVKRMAHAVLQVFSRVDVLVNSAGTNVPQRSLRELSTEDYLQMINTNQNGAFYCTQAFLPEMRSRGNGTIVNIVSDAGKLASAKAGPGYVMSKFGLAGLTQSINAEERGNGIRACAIFPGDIDTPLLERRPQPPDAAARSRMMRAEDVAQCVVFCLGLPPNVTVEEMLVRPR